MVLEERSAGTIDWSALAETEHRGQSGKAAVRAFSVGKQQMRLVTYSPGYVGDHWCDKAHLTFLLSGAVEIAHADGTCHHASTGMSYYVAGGEAQAHRLSSPAGATLFIVDQPILD